MQFKKRKTNNSIQIKIETGKKINLIYNTHN